MSEPDGRARIELTRRGSEERIEVTAVYDTAARADPIDPGVAARDAACAALLFALEVEASPGNLAEVEVLGGRGEPPELEVTGELAVRLRGRAVHVSLTHEGPVVAALVVLSLAPCT